MLYLGKKRENSFTISATWSSPIKTEYLGSRDPRLHSDEVLIALSASAAENPLAQQAMEQLSHLKGSMAHASVKLSSADYKTFRKLGIDLTFEPVPEQK